VAHFGLGRRALLGAAGTSLLAAPRLAQAQTRDITVQIWGSTWTGSFRQIGADFEKQTGIKVNAVTQATSGEGLVRLQSMRAAPQIDVWFTTASVAERAKTDAQLFLPLPYESIPAAAAIEPGARGSHWVGVYFYQLGIIWRTDLVKQPITSWQELWAPRFARQLCIPVMNSYQARMLLVAAEINGGGLANVEPGFEALKRLKSNVVSWFSSDTTARQGLAQGEYGVLVSPPGALKRMIDADVPAQMVSPKPSPMMYDSMMLVNTPKRDAALRFMDFCLTQDRQDFIAKGQGMGPVHPGAKTLPVIEATLPAAADRVSYDDDFINTNIGAWNDRFSREIAS
jgi:spermidine/putrescine-binding protein